MVPVFMDEKYWGDPMVFRPERFLDSSGQIIPSIAERLPVFGFGKFSGIITYVISTSAQQHVPINS